MKLQPIDKESYDKGLRDGAQDRNDTNLLSNLNSAARQLREAQLARHAGKGLWAFAYWSGYIVGLMTITNGSGPESLYDRVIQQTEVLLTQEFPAFKE